MKVTEFIRQVPDGVEALTSGGIKWAAAAFAPLACIVLLIALLWKPYQDLLGPLGVILAVVIAVLVCSFSDAARTHWAAGKHNLAGLMLAMVAAMIGVDTWVSHAGDRTEMARRAEMLGDIARVQRGLDDWRYLTVDQANARVALAEQRVSREAGRTVRSPDGRGQTQVGLLDCSSGNNPAISVLCSPLWTAQSEYDAARLRRTELNGVRARLRQQNLPAEYQVTDAELEELQAQVDARADWLTDPRSAVILIIHLLMVAAVMWADWVRSQRRAGAAGADPEALAAIQARMDDITAAAELGKRMREPRTPPG